MGKEGEHRGENEWDFYQSPNLDIPESVLQGKIISFRVQTVLQQ